MIRVLTIVLPLLGLLAGCAEYKEYQYVEYNMSREEAYDAVTAVLAEEGYVVEEYEEDMVNDLPAIYLTTGYNMRQAHGVFRGNSVRRKAYVKIVTLYTERDTRTFQPLNKEDGERIKKYNETEKKQAELEHTRIGVAVRLERRNVHDRPLATSDYTYDGQDGLARAEILGKLEMLFGGTKGDASRPSNKGEKLYEERLRSGNK